MTNQNFYQQLRNILIKESVVIATIVKVNGSAPREVGAKMAIRSDGSIIGTIGGGAGEAKVIDRALKVLKTGVKQLVEIDLTGAPGKNIQGVCGGRVRIWLEKWSEKKAIALVKEILELFKTGRSAQLVTPFTQDDQPYLSRDRQYGKLAQYPYIATQFIETIEPPPILLIIGAGHVGLSLAQIASLAGFQIVVQDDRPEFVTERRFPHALFLSQSLTETLNNFNTNSQLYVALVTRGYLKDIEALERLLQYPIAYQYIGAIGSQKRVRMLEQKLQQKGIFLEQLSNFYAPIGLDIGALTPEEIAVSICGELIKVRRGGTGLSLCERMQHSKQTSKVHPGERLYARWQ